MHRQNLYLTKPMFNSLYITTTTDWLLATALIAVISMIREYLVVYRTYRIQQYRQRKHSQAVEYNTSRPLINTNTTEYTNKITQTQQCIDSMLYGFSLLISYMLMLLFMTYNVAVCSILVICCTISHFITSYYVSNWFNVRSIGRGVTQADHCCDDVNEY